MAMNIVIDGLKCDMFHYANSNCWSRRAYCFDLFMSITIDVIKFSFGQLAIGTIFFLQNIYNYKSISYEWAPLLLFKTSS